MGAGALEGRYINALLLGNAFGERRSKNTGAVGLWLRRAGRGGGWRGCRRSRRSGSFWCGCSLLQVTQLLPIAQYDCDGSVHKNIVSAFGHQNLAKGSLVNGF